MREKKETLTLVAPKKSRKKIKIVPRQPVRPQPLPRILKGRKHGRKTDDDALWETRENLQEEKDEIVSQPDHSRTTLDKENTTSLQSGKKRKPKLP